MALENYFHVPAIVYIRRKSRLILVNINSQKCARLDTISHAVHVFWELSSELQLLLCCCSNELIAAYLSYSIHKRYSRKFDCGLWSVGYVVRKSVKIKGLHHPAIKNGIYFECCWYGPAYGVPRPSFAFYPAKNAKPAGKLPLDVRIFSTTKARKLG